MRTLRPTAAVGPAIGLLAGAMSVGVGEFAAAFVRPAASPVIVVGNRFILLTPEPLKRWAISNFGTSDKTALLTGIYLALALLALLIGAAAARRRAVGVAGIVGLGLIGVYCALTTNAHQASDVLPSVIGAAAGVAALELLRGTLVGAGPVGAGPIGAGPIGAGPIGAGPIGTPAVAWAVASEAVAEVPAAGADRRQSLRGGADRRQFLRGGAVAAVAAAIAGFGGRALQRTRFNAEAARAAITLPAAAPPAALTGYDLGRSPVPFSTPSKDFYRIDTALSVPQLNPNTWRLRIHGKVDRELTLSYADLLARPLVERWVTLTCVSNEVGGDLVGTSRFRGVLLADLLREAGIGAGADQLLATSSDGMTIGSPTAVVMDGRDAMLAVGMDGEPLPTEHGFPVRMVVPGLYGYVSACKWIVSLEATTFAADQAYWVRGGWAAQGPVRLASRIDTPSSSATVPAGRTVPVAGIAWDQHVGVSKVQLQVDRGEWITARLAPVPSTDTWRQWVALWSVPSQAGVHTLRVRAYDADGRAQDDSMRDPFPAGATGLHTISVRAR